LSGGLLLWRREPLGYVGGAGLLLQYSLLFTGAIPCMVFPAVYNASPIDVTGLSSFGPPRTYAPAVSFG